MKNKFYASLFIGIGLTLAAMPGLAKTAQASKKPAASSAKPAKTVSGGKKPESKQTLTKAKSDTRHQDTAGTKDKSHTLANNSKQGKTKTLVDSHDRHGKTKTLADGRDTKHGKTKTLDLVSRKDSKHGKMKSHELADAKDKKHGKVQQLVDARDKHGRRKSHQVVDHSEQENEESASTAVYEETTQATDDSVNTDTSAVESSLTSENNTHTENQTFATAPKPSPLFFPPLNTHNDHAPSIDNRPKMDELATKQTANNPPLFAEQRTTEATSPVTHGRVHTSIIPGTIPQITSSKNENKILPENKESGMPGQIVTTHGVVESSLTTAGEKAGLSNEMIIELTEIFAWDVDFANNLQADDQFTVIYEAGTGGNARNKIIAAEFVNRGKSHIAIRYKDKDGIIGYYNRGGQSVRKAFLTTPVDFARVSSPFSTHRRHPILNRIRAHKGVDYAARTGTPVKAAGDGIVTFHGNNGAYGRMIVISHGEHYETAYAHLSNFSNNLQDGKHVKQGDIIGYVGQSGLATGPHLHYEFRVDGVHQDPEQLDNTQGTLLTGLDWKNFQTQTMPPMIARLNAAKASTLFAENKPNASNSDNDSDD